MKIMITGGAGFIGSALIRYILETTNYEVLNIDKLTYAGNLESLPGTDKNNRYKFKQVDICDEFAIKNSFYEFRPNFVMHLAAESHVDRSISQPDIFLKTNILGTYNLLNNAKEYYESLNSSDKSKFRFHHISTDEVYGDLESSNDFFVESSPYDPSSPYSASKASSDHLVRAWNKTFNLPVLITNCSNNYGPYHFPEKLIPHIILNALKGNPLPVYGNGLQIRDWLFVDDHAKALMRVVINGKIGDTYNIGGHNEKTNIEVIRTICDLLEDLHPSKPNGLKSYRDLITYVEDRPGHDIRYAIDASKIKNELGWVPEESFESGIYKTVKWYIENQDWWERVLSGEYKLNAKHK